MCCEIILGKKRRKGKKEEERRMAGIKKAKVGKCDLFIGGTILQDIYPLSVIRYLGVCDHDNGNDHAAVTL